jgi:hypothetical protein
MLLNSLSEIQRSIVQVAKMNVYVMKQAVISRLEKQKEEMRAFSVCGRRIKKVREVVSQ